MLKLPALLCAILFAATAFSQTNTVSGIIQDANEKKPVKNAVVALLTPKDSVLYRFTRSGADGSFTLKNVIPGTYILMTTHPLFGDLLDNVEVKETALQLGTVSLTSKSKLLQEVIVKTGGAIKIKGDTTVYTADSFKVSANADVEELLKKLPGIQVDKNGEIKAMGEKVEKVLVDGEEFFGDDPGMAIKNLRADAVKEVQVFDKKSDQAEFTGIDDGKTKKTINLKLKEDKKKGYFGKADVAAGPLSGHDPRYTSNLMLSSFKGKRKISGFLLNGNTGQDGLNWQDEQKYGVDNENTMVGMDDESGGMFIMVTSGSSSDEEPYINTQNGFLTNTNAGISYSNKWNNDRAKLSLSPKFNAQNYNNTQTQFTQTQAGDTALNSYSSLSQRIKRYNYKNSATAEFKLDSAGNSTLKITAKANVYHTESNEDRVSSTTSEKGTLKNSSNTVNNNIYNKNVLGGTVLYKHKFAKARRTISLNASWNSMITDSKLKNISANRDYSSGLSQDINQQRTGDKNTQTFSTKAVYTEPLSKNYAMELGYELSYNQGTNNQVTYAYNPVTNMYDVTVDSLTNNFLQKITINKPSVKLSYSTKKIKYNFGSGFGLTSFDFNDRTTQKDTVRRYTNFFPTASFNYMYKANHNIRVNYNGNTAQPTLNQLQPLRNNDNFFSQYIGNPDLKPSFTNNVSIDHNSYNFLKELWMYQSVSFNQTSNAFSSHRTLNLLNGKTITQPVNINGNYRISGWGGMGFKLKKINTYFNLNLNVNYNRYAEILTTIRGSSNTTITNYSRNAGAGLGFNLSKTKDKKYDIGISNNIDYNRNITTQLNTPNRYFTNTLRFDGTVYYKKVWSLSSSYEFYARQKTTQFNGLNNNLWNARIQRTFKNDEFTLYAMARDLLNQNIGIDRNFDGIYTSEVRNDRVKRYFMLGFAWNFKNKTAKAPAAPAQK
jgi:hypothetical protein